MSGGGVDPLVPYARELGKHRPSHIGPESRGHAYWQVIIHAVNLMKSRVPSYEDAKKGDSV
jgi:hypothetical protein